MPTTVIHEIVSKKITQKYPQLNSYNYYLGNIAPDAVNLNGFADKPIRWEAHLRDADLEIWRKKVYNFYTENKNNYDELFLKGYVTHIITDILYDKYLYNSVTSSMREINLFENDAHKYMLEEMNSYGNNNPYYEEVTKILSMNNNSFDILNIDKELLNGWKKKVTTKKLPIIQNKYITEKVVDELAQLVLEDLITNEII